MYQIINIYSDGYNQDGYSFPDEHPEYKDGYEIHLIKDDETAEMFFLSSTRAVLLKDTEKKINTAIKELESVSENTVEDSLEIKTRLENLQAKKNELHELNKMIFPQEQLNETEILIKNKVITPNDDKAEFLERNGGK